MPTTQPNHFNGKSVPQHLIEARIKGAKASAEIHGTEISGQTAAFADSIKDTALLGALLWVIFPQKLLFILLILFCWTLWKGCRSACFGWARLERLHRVIEEERWEIEHHREQEREELMEIYQAKGFQGELLAEVIDVLMADDNRLLQVMLEEELNIPLESYEHPLKQAFGAFVGALLISFGIYLMSLLFPPAILPVLLIAFLGAGIFTARIERIYTLSSFTWNLAIFILVVSTCYFIKDLI